MFCFVFLHLQCCVLVVDSKVRNNKERTLDAEPSINMINPLKLRQSCKLIYFKTELYCCNKMYFGERKTVFTSYMFFGFHSFKHPFLESIHYLITVCKKKKFHTIFSSHRTVSIQDNIKPLCWQNQNNPIKTSLFCIYKT